MYIDFASLDDNALIALIVLGNETALAVLYDRRVSLVFNIAHCITDDWLSAEEVAQDVFHEVWRHSSRYQSSRGSVTDWLVGITKFRSIDKIRTRAYRVWVRDQGTSGMLQMLPAKTRSTEEQVSNQELLKEALDILPFVQRQVIELVCCLGFSYMDASAALGIPLGTLKTRLRLGRLHLCTWFEANQELYY